MFCSCDDYYFGTLEMYKKLFAGNLGVIFDSNLMFDKQINATIRTSFFHLRLLAKVKPCLCFRDFERAIAFISSRLDFCNSHYSGQCVIS